MPAEYFEKYNHKILSLSSLRKKLNLELKNKKIIMCHGVFDIVHPGHVRHLAYAKSKADILIVSITADKHIKKGIYRPHVPEKLRAVNLAAFEMVDYVIIDSNSNPLKNLKIIKPDFFAKGFEYSSKGMPIETQKEIKVIESYGGEMIFTPGDVVYSSSKFLKLSYPKIHIEKLLTLMSDNKLTFEKLKKTIKQFNKIKIHVVGDTIVDTYTRTTLIGGQTKTPTFSVLHQNKEEYVGGAGVVALHLKAAGAKVKFTTILGDDVNKDFVIKSVKNEKILINQIVLKDRPTTNKNVIITDDYRLLKIDTLDNQPISKKIIDKICNLIKKDKSDAVIFSDFRHGIFHNNSIDNFIKSIPKKIFKVADSQVATRWGNITDFKNFDMIFPNEKEARFSLGDQDSNISSLTRRLIKETKCRNLILKLGNRGLVGASVLDKNDYATSIPSFATNVVDPVGAGDALLAYSTLSMLVSKSIVISSIIGSIAGACECEIDGNMPIKPSLVYEKIEQINKSIMYKS